MKKVLIIALLFSSLIAEASHLLGGQITWECLPSGHYRFTLVLFRDCTGGPLTNTVQYISGCNGPFTAIPCTKIATNYINAECGALPCDSISPNYLGAIEEHIYRSSPINLPGSPPPNGWRFEWSSCCRPGSITNLQNPSNQGFNLRTIMYPYTPPGSSTPVPAMPCYNSSPNFLESPNAIFCAGSNAQFLSNAKDLDGDSLIYDWDQPMVNTACTIPSTVIWDTTQSANYSFDNPLPDSTQNVLNNPAFLDTDNGLVYFKSYTTGAFASCIRVDEYRHDQLIASVFRDIPIFIKSCAGVNQCNSTPPTYSQVDFDWVDPLDSIYLVSSKFGGAFEEYHRYETAMLGDSVRFYLNIFDSDSTSNCQLEEIRLSGTSSPYEFYNGYTGCMKPYSCPRLYSLNANGGFTDSLENKSAFKWLVTCGNDLGPAEFIFKIENNSCPLPTVKIVKLTINVEINASEHPVFDTTTSYFDPINNTTNLTWSKPDTGTSFEQYVLWHSTGGQPIILDSIKSYFDTSYTHINPPSGANWYWVRTSGGCRNTLDSVDFNYTEGRILIKNTIGIEENGFGLTYYPQPMANEIVFEGFKAHGDVQIDMINAIGAKVRSTSVKIVGGKVKADVSDLPAGIYVFVLFWDGYSSKIKLVKHE